MTEQKIAVAPMMDWTDRHCRYFLRQISPRARLYTEMLTAAAVVHGERLRLLRFDPCEHPVALQLGGSDPGLMAEAARAGAEAGYDEININVGCPSDRVQSGAFGACLMAEPETVARSVSAMREAVDVPVTVKTRIGIDDQDSEVFFRRFIGTVAAAGCDTFVVHARKAILSGLSPKENRSIPPLDYARVYRLKEDFRSLRLSLTAVLPALRNVTSTCPASTPSCSAGRRTTIPGSWLNWSASLRGIDEKPHPSGYRDGHAALYRTGTILRYGAETHHPAHAGTVCRPARRACLAALPERKRPPNGRRAGSLVAGTEAASRCALILSHRAGSHSHATGSQGTIISGYRHGGPLQFPDLNVDHRVTDHDDP